MFKKVIFLMGIILLISSLSLLRAAEEPRLSSAPQQDDVQGSVQKIPGVGDIRTLTVKQPLKLRTTRADWFIPRTSVQRDQAAGKVITPVTEPSQAGEQIFQKPVQERKSSTGQLE